MGVDTLLVAVGADDQDRVDEFVGAVADIAEPTGATVVIAHVIEREHYRRTVDQLEATAPQSTAETSGLRNRWLPLSATRSGDDVPEWTVEWSSLEKSAVAADSDSPHVQAFEAVLGQKKLIRDLVHGFDETGVEYEVRGAIGEPADRIVALADSLEPDFVVVGGRNRSSAQQALFGSVSQQIVRNVRCPVISIRRGDRR